MRQKGCVTKAVFPVAGFGTRFLPITKTIPKEMLPVIDTPLIQYAVQEAIDAGITELIFVTSQNKVDIEDYFDKNSDLENRLLRDGKSKLLSLIDHILPKNVVNVYMRQLELLGLGHAVLCAKKLIGNEPFAVILPDDLMEGANGSCLKNMISFYENNEDVSCVLATKEVDPSARHHYGIVGLCSEKIDETKVQILVEKPITYEVKSNLAILGRYILSPEIFIELEKNSLAKDNELQLTDAIANLLLKENIHIYRFNGTHFDCGSKLGYIKANVTYALKRPDLEQSFKEFLKGVVIEF